MDRYTILNQLGSGSYGAAHLAVHNETQAKFVLKEIKISHLNNSDLENAKKEVKVLSSLVHNHITKFEESFENAGLLYIVMEYCAVGDLQNLISNRKGIYFPEDRILDWFTQLCLAVKFIHDRHIIHRDIKTQNVFLSEDGKVKLGDFGIAKMLDTTNDLANTCVGTPYYLSPEMCENKPYSNKSDVWAVGCVLHEMTSLKHAFDAPNMKSLLVKIIKCSYKGIPQRYSRDLRNLVREIFQRDPKSRPSVTSILRSKLLFKRLPRLITDKDPELLLRPTRKQLKCTPFGKLSVHKRMGLTDPSSKYGISPALKKYGLKSSKPLLSPRPIGNKTQASANFKGNVGSKRTSPNYQKFSLGNLNTHSQRKRKSTANSSQGHLRTSKVSRIPKSSKVQLALEKGEYENMELSSFILSSMGDAKALLESSSQKQLYRLILTKNLANSNYGSLNSQSSDGNRDEKSEFRNHRLKQDLFNKVFDIVDHEVSELSQSASERREASYFIWRDSLHLNDASAAPCVNYLGGKSRKDICQNTVYLNDIQVNIPPLGETYVLNSHKYEKSENCATSIDDPLDFSTPHKKRCSHFSTSTKNKWQCPQTPIFGQFPLETSTSQMDGTSSTDLVVVYNARKQWEKRANDIVKILATAELSSGSVSLDSRGNSFISLNKVRSPLLPSRMTRRRCLIKKSKRKTRTCKVSRKSLTLDFQRLSERILSAELFQSLPSEDHKGLSIEEESCNQAFPMSPPLVACGNESYQVKCPCESDVDYQVIQGKAGNDNKCASHSTSPLSNAPESLELILPTDFENLALLTSDPQVFNTEINSAKSKCHNHNVPIEALKMTCTKDDIPNCFPLEPIPLSQQPSTSIQSDGSTRFIKEKNSNQLQSLGSYGIIADSDAEETSTHVEQFASSNDSLPKIDSLTCAVTPSSADRALEHVMLSPDTPVDSLSETVSKTESDPRPSINGHSNDDKKSRKSLFKFFHKSSNNTSSSFATKDEKLASSHSPLSKTKSRFSGIFRRLMSPRHPRNKSESSLNASDMDETTDSQSSTKENLLQKNFKTTDNPPIREKIRVDPAMEIDIACDSGVHSCFSDLTSSNARSPDLKNEGSLASSQSSISNTCIERNLTSDTDSDPLSDIANIDDGLSVVSKGKLFERNESIRKTACDLVDCVLLTATSQLKEEHLQSFKSLDPVSSLAKPTTMQDPTTDKPLHTIDSANPQESRIERKPPNFKSQSMHRTTAVDTNGNVELVDSPKDNDHFNSEDAEDVLLTNSNNYRSLSKFEINEFYNCKATSLESSVIYSDVTPPLRPEKHQRTGPTLSFDDYLCNAKMVEDSHDIYGWIEAQKESLEQKLGLELFLDCYRCLESAFNENGASLNEAAMEEVKTKLGKAREFLLKDIAHIIISESVYLN